MPLSQNLKECQKLALDLEEKNLQFRERIAHMTKAHGWPFWPWRVCNCHDPEIVVPDVMGCTSLTCCAHLGLVALLDSMWALLSDPLVIVG